MTSLLGPLISTLALSPILQPTYFTCPNPGIPSINSPSDSAESAQLCLPHLLPLLPHHDCFLVACYSQHPLVDRLRAAIASYERRNDDDGGGHADSSGRRRRRRRRKYVTGIFEASVGASLALIGGGGGDGDSDSTDTTKHHTNTFGIVSTDDVGLNEHTYRFDV